jgi:hypothetical protein
VSPRRLKPENQPVIAAVNRCATQKSTDPVTAAAAKNKRKPDFFRRLKSDALT